MTRRSITVAVWRHRLALSTLALAVIAAVGFAVVRTAQPRHRDSWANVKKMFPPGTPFPDILLPSLESGQPTSMADFRGKKILFQLFASG
jgi:hypothetical protein